MTTNCLFSLHLSKIQNFIDASAESQAAFVHASAYRSKAGYPVLVSSDFELISGSIYKLKDSQIQLSMLDELMGYNPQNIEASLFHRTLISANLAHGDTCQVWIYFLNPKKLTADFKHVENGNWQKSLQESPPLTEKLSEKQKSYIKRLGTCLGRDVIPIDLALYRELMNLELIVDKGRRLALSKFGKEVFSYIQ